MNQNPNKFEKRPGAVLSVCAGTLSTSYLLDGRPINELGIPVQDLILATMLFFSNAHSKRSEIFYRTVGPRMNSAPETEQVRVAATPPQRVDQLMKRNPFGIMWMYKVSAPRRVALQAWVTPGGCAHTLVYAYVATGDSDIRIVHAAYCFLLHPMHH